MDSSMGTAGDGFRDAKVEHGPAGAKGCRDAQKRNGHRNVGHQQPRARSQAQPGSKQDGSGRKQTWFEPRDSAREYQ
jgi:hypothetical protein